MWLVERFQMISNFFYLFFLRVDVDFLYFTVWVLWQIQGYRFRWYRNLRQRSNYNGYLSTTFHVYKLYISNLVEIKIERQVDRQKNILIKREREISERALIAFLEILEILTFTSSAIQNIENMKKKKSKTFDDIFLGYETFQNLDVYFLFRFIFIYSQKKNKSSH